jgi:AraC-like DNA-binding protein
VAAADALPDAPRWARLAVAAGYYDQPHLIREFRSLAGLTPGEVHRERARQRGSTDE